MEAFIRPGLDPKNWGGAHGNSTPAWGLLQSGPEEVSLYWSEHYDNYPRRDSTPRLRRGTLRLDGFVSVHSPYQGGECVTKPLVFEGKHLQLNVSTSAIGSVRVELQDEAGRGGGSEPRRLPGNLGRRDRTSCRLEGRRRSERLGRATRAFRFVMKDADLYAFQFVP